MTTINKWPSRYFKARNLILIIVFICLFAAAYSFLDPDFPWHMRHGTDILSGNFYFNDPYSYTMPSYKYIDHSWGMSVIFALVYSKFHLGYVGVAALCSLIATIGIYIASGNAIWIMPLLAASCLDNFGTRAQATSFLLTATIIALMSRSKKNIRMLAISIPLILFLWVNLHGGFILGVIYLWGYWIIDILLFSSETVDSKLKMHLFFIVLTATLVTAITPYFLGTWRETLSTIINPLNRYVLEWQPATRVTSFSLLALISLFFTTLWLTKKVRWLEIFTILLLLNGLLSTRVLPLFALSASFVIVKASNKFLANKMIDKKRLLQILRITIIFGVILLIIETILNVRSKIIVSQLAYPENAVIYISKNPHEGNIFSILHWNTYLLWKSPKNKVFIDGRMIPWRQDTKPNELQNALQSYISLSLKNEPIKPILEEFCITRFLWTRENSPSQLINEISPINLTEELDKKVWKIVYEDEASVLYERPLPNSCKNS